jgi:hypothetical protein
MELGGIIFGKSLIGKLIGLIVGIELVRIGKTSIMFTIIIDEMRTVIKCGRSRKVNDVLTFLIILGTLALESFIFWFGYTNGYFVPKKRRTRIEPLK